MRRTFGVVCGVVRSCFAVDVVSLRSLWLVAASDVDVDVLSSAAVSAGSRVLRRRNLLERSSWYLARALRMRFLSCIAASTRTTHPRPYAYSQVREDLEAIVGYMRTLTKF